MFHRCFLTCVVGMATIVASCGDEDAAPAAALVRVTDEPPGPSCTFGGKRIDTGLDDGSPGGAAQDGVLQTEEIDQTDYVCAYGVGISEGSQAAPVVVEPGVGLTGTVAAAGSSYYQLTPTASVSFLIRAGHADSDLSWTLYSDAWTTEIASCDQRVDVMENGFCATPVLTASTTYRLRIDELANRPSSFVILAQEELLIGVTAEGTLYAIDSGGLTTLLSVSGVAGIAAMEFDARTGVLYAGLGTGPCPGCIIAIDPFSGYNEFLMRAGDYSFAVRNMAIRLSDGNLFVFEEDANHLVGLDPATGGVTELENPGCCANSGMAFDSAGTLYSATFTNLYTIDAATGVGSDAGTLTFSGLGAINSIALATRWQDDTIFALTSNNDLVTVDPAGPQITLVRNSVYPDLTALAYVGGLP